MKGKMHEEAVSVGIVGNYGHHNVGDEAILRALVTQLQGKRRDAEIIIFSDDLQDTQGRFPDCTCRPLTSAGASRALRAVKSLTQWWHASRHLDLLIVGGGGLFVDSYRRTPWQLLTLILMARLAGSQVLCYQIGVGPITRPEGKLLFRLSAEMANAISVRDVESERTLRKLGVRREIAVQADAALLLEPAAIDAPWPDPPTQDRPLVGIAPVPYCAPGFWYEADQERFHNYVTELSIFTDDLVEQYGAVPVFFRFSRGDDMAARAIQGQMRHATNTIILPEEYDPGYLLALMGKTDFFLGTRLHSLIFATKMLVPPLAIAYQEKVRNYLRAVGQESMAVDIESLSAQSLMQRFKDLQHDRFQIQMQLQQRVPLLQDQALKGIDWLFDHLDQQG